MEEHKITMENPEVFNNKRSGSNKREKDGVKYVRN